MPDALVVFAHIISVNPYGWKTCGVKCLFTMRKLDVHRHLSNLTTITEPGSCRPQIQQWPEACTHSLKH